MAIVTDIKNGLKTRLETITGIRVHNQPVDSVQELPACIILTEQIGYPLAFGGNAMEGQLRIVFLVDSAVKEQAVRDLDKYLHPGNGSAVVRAIYGDDSLGTTVDQIVSVSAENIGVRRLNDGDAIGADFVVRWVRSS